MFCRQIRNHKTVIILTAYLSGSHQFFCVIGFFCNPGFDSNRTALDHDEYRLYSQARFKMARQVLYGATRSVSLFTSYRTVLNHHVTRQHFVYSYCHIYFKVFSLL